MIDLSSPAGSTREAPLHLRLYVIPPGPNSVRAVENLSQLMRAEGKEEWQVEIVDVSEDPEGALLAGILVTPTLVKVSPPPVVKIIGDLADRDTVLAVLNQR